MRAPLAQERFGEPDSPDVDVPSGVLSDATLLRAWLGVLHAVFALLIFGNRVRKAFGDFKGRGKIHHVFKLLILKVAP